MLQLKSNENLFKRKKRIKVTDLFRSFAHLCCPCSNDMHSQNFTVLIKKRCSGSGNQTTIGLMQKWKYGID